MRELINRVHFGDCRDSMRKFHAEGLKVQSCVTSPPYFGLRDYGHPGQIGLESSPVEYVDALVEVFRCVRDILADDGVLWLNLGDSYASKGGENVPHGGNDFQKRERGKSLVSLGARSANFGSLKPKDLIGIPWRVAFALQDDGWYLRQDIIWHKPNPMPESVTDRCTKAHEYLFMLTKSERYYWNQEAMKEPATGGAPGNSRPTKSARSQKPEHRTAANLHDIGPRETRNRRSVWTIPTRPYSGAHFAVFPKEIVEPCVLAGSRPGDVVLDPFMGSGTTAEVAQNLGRHWIGCELNEEYRPLQESRVAQGALLL